jgi:hypothetical protein
MVRISKGNCPGKGAGRGAFREFFYIAGKFAGENIVKYSLFANSEYDSRMLLKPQDVVVTLRLVDRKKLMRPSFAEIALDLSGVCP